MNEPAERSFHTSDEELLDYYEEKLPESRQQWIEEHLAVCDACTGLARSVYTFNETWNAWTAAGHGQAYYEEYIQEALRRAETSQPQWRARLQRWRQRWGGRGEAALRVVTEATSSAARAVAEGVDALSRRGSTWRLQPVPLMQSAFAIRGEASPATDVAVFATGTDESDEVQARITVRAALSGEVKVRVDNLQDDAQAPLVLLIATSPPAASVLVERVSRQASGYWIAHFREVPPGEYLVVIEPLGS